MSSLVLSHRELISSLSPLHSVPTLHFPRGNAREGLARLGEGLPYPSWLDEETRPQRD